MNDGDKRRFAEAMVALTEYYGKSVSDGVIELYWQGLRHYDFEAISEAMRRHMHNPDSGQFMPKIADVAKMLGGTSQDAALQAWAKVDRAVRQVGTYSDVAFDDPLIHRVIHEMGGWMGLGTKTEDEWPFVAREFENRYRGYRSRSEIPEYPPVLIGIAGAANRKNGHAVAPPTLIGNTEAAKGVIERGAEKPLLGIQRATAALEHLRLVPDSGKDAA